MKYTLYAGPNRKTACWKRGFRGRPLPCERKEGRRRTAEKQPGHRNTGFRTPATDGKRYAVFLCLGRGRSNPETPSQSDFR